GRTTPSASRAVSSQRPARTLTVSARSSTGPPRAGREGGKERATGEGRGGLERGATGGGAARGGGGAGPQETGGDGGVIGGGDGGGGGGATAGAATEGGRGAVSVPSAVGPAGRSAVGAGPSSTISSGAMITVPGISSGRTFRTTSPTRMTSPGCRAARSTFLPFTKTPLALPASRMASPCEPASRTACRREQWTSFRTRSQAGSRPSTASVPWSSTSWRTPVGYLTSKRMLAGSPQEEIVFGFYRKARSTSRRVAL